MTSNFSVGNKISLPAKKNNIHFKGYVNAQMEEGTSVASPALMGAQWRDRLQNRGLQPPAPAQHDSHDSYASREEAPQYSSHDSYGSSSRVSIPTRRHSSHSDSRSSSGHHSSHHKSSSVLDGFIGMFHGESEIRYR